MENVLNENIFYLHMREREGKHVKSQFAKKYWKSLPEIKGRPIKALNRMFLYVDWCEKVLIVISGNILT